jgi:hypothetical protein
VSDRNGEVDCGVALCVREVVRWTARSGTVCERTGEVDTELCGVVPLLGKR